MPLPPGQPTKGLARFFCVLRNHKSDLKQRGFTVAEKLSLA